MTQKPRKGDFKGVKVYPYPPTPTPPRSLRLRRSFRKSVSELISKGEKLNARIGQTALGYAHEKFGV